MSERDHPRVDSLFEAALDLNTSAERIAYLEQACRGDRVLQEQVERLLRADREAGSFLDVPGCEQLGDSVVGSFQASFDDIPSVMLRDVDEKQILKPSVMELRDGNHTSRYHLLGEIARGGMGAIIRGHDADLGRDLALKVLLDEHKDNADCVRRFIEEAQISGQLQHPGITPVFELGKLGDQRPYFSMKLVKGQTLAAILESRPTTDADHGKLLGVFEQVCQTMAYAHSRGVIHRDLKPANVMVGKFGEVQVMDWGLAKVLHEGHVIDEQASNDAPAEVTSPGASSLDTRLGSVMGTFPYMPPEQALGEIDRLDERADVFALGAILCEILTGKPAYVAPERTELQRMAAGSKLEDCFARLDDSRAEPELVALAKRCLAPEPSERIRHAGIVAEQFAKFQDSLEERLQRAEHERIASETKANEERRRKTIYVGVCCVLACIGAVAFYTAGSIRSLYLEKVQLVAEKERASEVAEQQRQRADQAAHVAKIRWLVSESWAQQLDKPETAVLLALEAYRLCQENDEDLLAFAHEALLNATQSLGGQVLPHDAKLTAMQMSKQRLVTLSGGVVRVFDLTSRDPHRSPRILGGTSHSIQQIALSRNGRWLLTLGNALQRWDLSNEGEEPQNLPCEERILSATLSGDGRWVVGQDQRGAIRRWDCETPESVGDVLSEDSLFWDQITVSHNGSGVALKQGQSACKLLRIRNASVEQVALEVRYGKVFAMAFSDDGRWLAVGDRHGARLFDLQAPDIVNSVLQLPTPLYPTAIRGMKFSSDSRWLFGWHPGFPNISRWDLEAPGNQPLVFKGDHSGVRSLATTDSGDVLASGGGSGTVELIELSEDSVEPRRNLVKVHDWPVDRVALHPEGHWMATSADRSVRLWNLAAPNPMVSPFVRQGQKDQNYSPVATSSDGRWVATVVESKAVELWDTSQPQKHPTILRGHEEPIRNIHFADHDRWLVTHSLLPEQGTVRIWDLTTPDPNEHVREIPGVSCSIAADGQSTMAAVFMDKSVRLIDFNSPDLVGTSRKIGLHELDASQAVCKMTLSPDGRWLVTACQTTKPLQVQVYIWDLQAEDIPGSCQMIDNKKQFMHGNGIVIDATSRWLVTAGGFSAGEDSYHDTVTIRDLHADDIAAFSRTIQRKGDVWQVAVSPDCQWLFTARANQEVQLWDLRDGVIPHRLTHCGQSTAISPDGRWLAAGGRIHFNTYLFDLHAKEPWNSMRILRGHKAPVWALAFSEDGRWLITDSSDGSTRRWCMDTDWLMQYARESVSRELTQDERTYYGLGK